MSRKTQRNWAPKQLPPQSTPNEEDDDVIIPEIVDNAPNLVTPQIVQILIQENKQGDLQALLDTELNYNKQRFEIIRHHKEHDVDAVDHRKTKQFRRQVYGCLLVVAIGLFLAMPFVNLVAAGIFGTIGMIIICGAMLNARDRELDLAGMLQMIQAILQRRS